MLNDFDVIELPLVNVPIWSLKTAEPYVNLFPIQEQTLADIIEDMSVHGFDAGHPIVVWKLYQWSVVSLPMKNPPYHMQSAVNLTAAI